MDIDLTVLPDMRLVLQPVEVARDAEHNSATFRIVKQPAGLDAYVCRAEVSNANGTTYRLVEDGAFDLTNDIAVHGIGHLQLVYSNGNDVQRKTALAAFHVSRSVNAVDPSDPDFPTDAIAQLQIRSFASAIGNNEGIVFYNMGGGAVGNVLYPPQGAGDLTEDRANTLYLRVNGAGMMTGSILIEGQSRGIVFDATTTAPAIYADSLGFRFRRGITNSEITIENNDGSPISRSPILTLATGDTRYLTLGSGDARYVFRAGDIISGDLRLLSSAGIDALISLYLGGREARIAWDNGIVLRRGQGGESVYIENNNGANRSEVLTQLMGDARYVTYIAAEGIYARLNGSQFTGPLITQFGTSNTNLGLSVGENSSGFWKSSLFLIAVVGAQTVWQSSTTEMIFGVTLNAATQRVTNLGAPTAAGDATNRLYVDQRRAPTLVTSLTANIAVPANGDFVPLANIIYPIARGGVSRVRISVMINAANVISPTNANVRYGGSYERRNFLFNVGDSVTGFTTEFYADVNGTAPLLPFDIQSAGGVSAQSFTVLGAIADGPRSQIAISDLGPV